MFFLLLLFLILLSKPGTNENGRENNPDSPKEAPAVLCSTIFSPEDSSSGAREQHRASTSQSLASYFSLIFCADPLTM